MQHREWRMEQLKVPLWTCALAGSRTKAACISICPAIVCLFLALPGPAIFHPLLVVATGPGKSTVGQTISGLTTQRNIGGNAS